MKIKIEMGGRIIEIEIPIVASTSLAYNHKEFLEIIKAVCEQVKDMNK